MTILSIWRISLLGLYIIFWYFSFWIVFFISTTFINAQIYYMHAQLHNALGVGDPIGQHPGIATLARSRVGVKGATKIRVVMLIFYPCENFGCKFEWNLWVRTTCLHSNNIIYVWTTKFLFQQFNTLHPNICNISPAKMSIRTIIIRSNRNLC